MTRWHDDTMTVLLCKTMTKCQLGSRMGGGLYCRSILFWLCFLSWEWRGLTPAWPAVSPSCHKLDDFWTRWDKPGNSDTHAKVVMTNQPAWSHHNSIISWSGITYIAMMENIPIYLTISTSLRSETSSTGLYWSSSELTLERFLVKLQPHTFMTNMETFWRKLL